MILKSETRVKPEVREKLAASANTVVLSKKPPINQGLKDGVGDRGRTDDLMLGKRRERKNRR